MSHSSLARQNYHVEAEAAVNRHINVEMNASYVYQSMAGFFDRDDVSLKGFYEYFKKRSDSDRAEAANLIKYQNTRGGRIVFADIRKPLQDEWVNGLEAMQAALQLEKSVNQSLLEVHNVAAKHGDPQMTDYVEHLLKEQVELIKEIANHVTNLKRVGPGLGEYQFNHETLG